MNHNKSYRKLGRRSDHRLAMMKNMTISLVNAERIETTVTRAKELRKFVEKMITLGKKYNNFNLENNDERAKAIHLRRQAFAFLRNEEAVAKVFKEIAPKYMDRNGGYTRIINDFINGVFHIFWSRKSYFSTTYWKTGRCKCIYYNAVF